MSGWQSVKAIIRAVLLYLRSTEDSSDVMRLAHRRIIGKLIFFAGIFLLFTIYVYGRE